MPIRGRFTSSYATGSTFDFEQVNVTPHGAVGPSLFPGDDSCV